MLLLLAGVTLVGYVGQQQAPHRIKTPYLFRSLEKHGWDYIFFSENIYLMLYSHH